MNQDNRPAPGIRRRAAPRPVDIQPILTELIAVLKPQASGLRRWSVMNAMRDNRKRKSRDIPHKFEDDIERVFRRFCADTAGTLTAANENAPFYLPPETAGEVWAMHPERAEALLAGEGPDGMDSLGRSDHTDRSRQ